MVRLFIDVNTMTLFTDGPAPEGENILEFNAMKSVETFSISPLMYHYKNQWRGVHRSRGIQYPYFNQYFGNKSTPTLLADYENGKVLAKDSNKLTIHLGERRNHKGGKDYTYRIDVKRDGKFQKAGEFITKEIASKHRKLAMSVHTIDFEFKKGDMVILSSTSKIKNCHSYTNQLYIFE